MSSDRPSISRRQKSFGIIVPPEARWLKLIRDFCRPILQELVPEESDRVLLAIDESNSNVVRHRCSTLSSLGLSLQISWCERRLRLRWDNFCRETEVASIGPRDLAEVRPGGLGTHFVGAVMDSISYEVDPQNPDVCSLVLEKELTEQESEHER